MAPKKAGPRESYLQPDRENKQALIAWIPKETHRAFKAMAATRGKSMAEATLEAVEAWIKKGGK